MREDLWENSVKEECVIKCNIFYKIGLIILTSEAHTDNSYGLPP